MRVAIEECSDVGSEFFDVDVKNHLSALMNSQLDMSKSQCLLDLSQNIQNDSKLSIVVDAENRGQRYDTNLLKTPCSSNSEPLINNHDLSQAYLTNKDTSAKFDGLPPQFTSFSFIHPNEDASLSQLYGSAWRYPSK